MVKLHRCSSILSIVTLASFLAMSFANVRPVFAQDQQPTATPTAPIMLASTSVSIGANTNKVDPFLRQDRSFFNDLATLMGEMLDKLEAFITTALQNTLEKAASNGGARQFQVNQAGSRLAQNQYKSNLPGFDPFARIGFGMKRPGIKGDSNKHCHPSNKPC
jgi:hypothetical protein